MSQGWNEVKGKQTVLIILIVCFSCTLGMSGYYLWRNNQISIETAETYQQLRQYDPSYGENMQEKEINGAAETRNLPIVALQERNPDVCGWITIDGTNINYPYVMSHDNNDYLRSDLDGEYLYAGTIFSDYRCAPDASDFLTILYGHNMKDGAMFSHLTMFADDEVWEQHRTGTLYLADMTYQMEIFAWLEVAANDAVLYQPPVTDAASFLQYVRGNAQQYRENDVTPQDHVLMLSTCSDTFSQARAVLLAKLVL